jgi:hypothetical protein
VRVAGDLEGGPVAVAVEHLGVRVGVEAAAREGQVDVVGDGGAGAGVLEDDGEGAVVGGHELDVDELADVALEQGAGAGPSAAIISRRLRATALDGR